MRLKDKILLLLAEDGGDATAGDKKPLSNERALALEAARAGAQIMVAGDNLEACEAIAAAVRSEGGKAGSIHCETENSHSCQNAARETVRRFGSLHLLVSTIANVDGADVLSLSEAQFDQLMTRNVGGTFRAIKATLPSIAKTGGSIVIVSSLSALRTGGAGIGYETSKAALIAMTRHIALSAAPNHVRVNCVLPGVLDSAAFAALAGDAAVAFAAKVPLGRLGAPEEFARAVIFLRSDDASYVNGTGLIIDGGLGLRV